MTGFRMNLERAAGRGFAHDRLGGAVAFGRFTLDSGVQLSLHVGAKVPCVADHGSAERDPLGLVATQSLRNVGLCVQRLHQGQRVAGRFGHAHAAMRPRDEGGVAG